MKKFIYKIETDKFQKITTFVQYVNIIKRLKGDIVDDDMGLGGR